MKDRGPNWGLAFGSGSFLIVWCLGFLSDVAVETIALRSCVATIMGGVLGMMVGQTIEGIRSLRDDLAKKGTKVDFTLPVSDDELSEMSAETKVAAQAGSGASSTAPGTANPATSASGAVPGETPALGPDFKPLDFKSAARQIQATMKE